MAGGIWVSEQKPRNAKDDQQATKSEERGVEQTLPESPPEDLTADTLVLDF